MKKCCHLCGTPPPLGVKLLILNYLSVILIYYSTAADGYTNSEFRNSIFKVVTIPHDGSFYWETKS